MNKFTNSKKNLIINNSTIENSFNSGAVDNYIKKSPNDRNHIIIEINKRIAKNEISECLDILLDFYENKQDSHLLKNILIVKSNFNLIKEQYNLNLIDIIAYNMQTSKIKTVIIDIVNSD